MMIDKQGKIMVDGVEYKGKYDRNEEHGAVVGQMGLCTFWKIIKELYLGRYKITISKYTEFKFGKDFSRGIAFDPPEEQPKEVA